MFLKCLEMQGFKSFPDKTKITFGKGLTAVVGPNGSGKSNISDAVRWVMGEQSTKTLRGDKMEDVIFGGTKFRKPQGFAEVSLTIDNTGRELAIDSDEITITRRYDRSGDSEYMINRSNVRLKDLHEIFMDTGLGKDGYSIVGQGKIAEIVQSKSTERREIFEEAAGISKYRYRKNESERSLERAEDNLSRLRDILSELEGRVEPLREQSEKAKEFLTLSDEKKSLEVSVWVAQIERTNQSLKDASDKITACEVSKSEAEEHISELEEQNRRAFNDMQQCSVKSDALRNEKEELERKIGETTSQIAVYKNNAEHNLQNQARIEKEITGHEETAEQAQKQIDEKRKQIDGNVADLNAVKEKSMSLQNALLKHSEESDSFNEKERRLTDEINALLLAQSECKMAKATAEAGITELSETIQSNRREAEQKNAALADYEKELKEQRDFSALLDDKIQGLNNTYAGHKMKLQNRVQKQEELKAECEKIGLSIKENEQKIRLMEGMEQSLDGYAQSVKEVLTMSKRSVLKGVYGTVSQLIEVDSDYAVAIETALGGAMQNIVVESENDAKAAIRALKQDNLGRATFLPITSVRGGELDVGGLNAYAGYVDIAARLVNCDEKYRGIVNSMLGRTVITDDIDTAVLIAQKNNYKFRIVTLDGQIVNAGGSLTGGSKNKGQSFLSRKNEIAQLKAQNEKISTKYDEIAENTEMISQEVAKIQAEFNAVTSEITTVNEDKIRVNGECKRLEELIFQFTQTVASMRSELKSKEQRRSEMEKSIAESTVKLNRFTDETASKNADLAKIQTDGKAVSENKSALADELSELNISTISIQKDIDAAKAEIENINQRQAQTGDLKEQLKLEIEKLTADNAEISSQVEEMTAQIGEYAEKIKSITEEVQNLIAVRQGHEAKATELNKQQRGASEVKEKISSELARLCEKKSQIQRDYDDVIEKLYSEYSITRSEAQAIAEPIEEMSKATAYLNKLKNKIRGLGSVNVAAIEEYKEVSERYEFLNAQIKDAEKAKSELLKLIEDLTRKMQEIFEENFYKINENFQQIFVELFGGGSAALTLSEPDDLLNSGIEISVEPPGKVIKNLASLSGGEQAFIAIAIYFAILKVHPAPFCILDEIEAALDDVNVDKYASYLRMMSDGTQFIMITHRRGSMEAADVLYGVTMQDEGVSKLLRLDISDVETELNAANQTERKV